MQIELHDGRKKILFRGDGGTFAFCERRKQKRNGVEVVEWTAYKWYSSLNAALARLAEIKLSHSEATTLEALREDVDRVRKEIIGLYKINHEV